MFAAGLYHLFEQQLLRLCRFGIAGRPGLRGELPRDAAAARKELLKVNINLNKVAPWQRIYCELRLVANAIKHGDGHSCEVLRRIRPGLFDDPELRTFPILRGERPVYHPLLGQGIYVELGDFTSYARSIVEFWGNVAKLIEGGTH
jgi:hypothetical protein